MYHNVEVGVRELRNNLRRWLAEVKKGKEIVVTERGKPIARIVSARGRRTLEQLVAEGLVTPAKEPKRPIVGPGVKTKGSVTELLLRMKRERPY